MNTEASSALLLIARFIGFSLFLQTIEFFKIKESFFNHGVWRWNEIRVELFYLPNILKKALDFIMSPVHFLEMMKIRLAFSFLLIIFPSWPLFQIIFCFTLFSISFLLTIRFRGSFNGGSDYLSLIILLCLSVGFLHPTLAKGALWYIALQVMSSYFLAGLVKIKQQKWRDGSAIYGFISSPSYQAPIQLIHLTHNQSTAKILSFALIFFELSFPLVLTHPSLTVLYLTAGIIFHFVNFIMFGLNRFFFVWCASYPALYYCSHNI